jgi:hypothetical protein
LKKYWVEKKYNIQGGTVAEYWTLYRVGEWQNTGQDNKTSGRKEEILDKRTPVPEY